MYLSPPLCLGTQSRQRGASAAAESVEKQLQALAGSQVLRFLWWALEDLNL